MRQTSLVQVPSVISHLALSKMLSLSEPGFPLVFRDNGNTHHIDFCENSIKGRLEST